MPKRQRGETAAATAGRETAADATAGHENGAVQPPPIQPPLVPAEAPRSRVLNAFGGPVSLTSGTQVEILPGTLQTALSEYAVTHAEPASMIGHKKIDVDDDSSDDDDSEGHTESEQPEPSAKLLLGFGESEIPFGGRTYTLTRQGFGNPTPKGGGLFTTLAISHAERSEKVAEEVKKIPSYHAFDLDTYGLPEDLLYTTYQDLHY